MAAFIDELRSRAKKIAEKHKHQYTLPPHVLAAALENENLKSFLRKRTVDVIAMSRDVESQVRALDKGYAGKALASPPEAGPVERYFVLLAEHASKSQHQPSESIFWAFLQERASPIAELIMHHGLDLDETGNGVARESIPAVFISHSSADKSRLKSFIPLLLEHFEVYIDDQKHPDLNLKPHPRLFSIEGSWANWIREGIHKCACVVVIWSTTSVKDRVRDKPWVRVEALAALGAKKLVQVAIDPELEYPKPFDDVFSEDQPILMFDHIKEDGSLDQTGIALLLQTIRKAIDQGSRGLE